MNIKLIQKEIKNSIAEYKKYYPLALEELDINAKQSGEAIHSELLDIDGNDIDNIMYHSGYIEGLKYAIKLLSYGDTII